MNTFTQEAVALPVLLLAICASNSVAIAQVQATEECDDGTQFAIPQDGAVYLRSVPSAKQIEERQKRAE